jgi:serine/threonine-protein phosphatase 2A regulatory subunit B'
VTQYVEKDATTAQMVIRGLIKCWPLSSSAKQITLLNELEEVLDLAGPDAVLPVARQLFRALARCVGSTHFQVAERALFLWNNEALTSSGILAKAHAPVVLPLLFAALTKNASGHWNNTVETLAQNVLKHYQEGDAALYERCAAAAAREPAADAEEAKARAARWAAVDAAAAEAAARGAAPASYALPIAHVVAAAAAAADAAAARGARGAGAGGGAGARPLSTSTAAILAASR